MRNTSRWPLDVYHCVCKYVYASEYVYVCSACRIHASVCLRACACVRVGARAVLAVLYGRLIRYTKVRALPESLGQCKLLETLCVPHPPACLLCAFAPLPALRCCACATARGAGPRRAALDAAAAVLPVVGRGRAPRAHGWRATADRRAFAVGRSRPARPHGWRAGTCPTPSSRSCRRRPTGRASRDCECRRRRAHTGAADAPTRGQAGRERAR